MEDADSDSGIDSDGSRHHAGRDELHGLRTNAVGPDGEKNRVRVCQNRHILLFVRGYSQYLNSIYYNNTILYSSRIMILPPSFPNISSPITFIEAGTDKTK